MGQFKEKIEVPKLPEEISSDNEGFELLAKIEGALARFLWKKLSREKKKEVIALADNDKDLLRYFTLKAFGIKPHIFSLNVYGGE